MPWTKPAKNNNNNEQTNHEQKALHTFVKVRQVRQQDEACKSNEKTRNAREPNFQIKF